MPDAPVRDERHEALEIFLGKWTARGTSYGGTGQTGNNPKANGEPWFSTHESRWHTGAFFVIEDERADIDGYRFDTLVIIGADENGGYFLRSFENHGHRRDYKLSRTGKVWTIEGATERARIEFSDGGAEQVIIWEWKPDSEWLPLCDRTAIKVG